MNHAELDEKLTKENFWNEMEERYPYATKLFQKWIDEYKRRVKWNELFNCGPSATIGEPTVPEVKYHDIPIDMQLGIFFEFMREVHEHHPVAYISGDLVLFGAFKHTVVIEYLKRLDEILSQRHRQKANETAGS